MGCQQTEPLYDDGVIKIERHPLDHEGHVVTIAERPFVFPSRVLDDAYRRPDGESLMASLEPINSTIMVHLNEAEISPERLGWALAKAKVNELEEELRDARSEISSWEDRGRH